jgi:hypothetical protein
MTDILENAISKHIIEIRFRPDGHFLDRRGQVAESLVGSSALFKHWNITANRIDFSSKDNAHVKAFLSYRNLGLASTSPNETAFFVESAEAFIKSAWNDLPNNEFSRIGIRSMFLVETDDFSKAREGYRKRFLKLSDEEMREFGGDLIDLGFPLHFQHDENCFNVMTGPMEREQSKQFFGEIDLPPTGIFVNIDYFRKNLSPHISQKMVLQLLNEGVEKARSVAVLIVDWVTE